MLMKRWSCGYRSLKSCLWFNNCSKKGMYKKIPYSNGVCMSDIKVYLEKKVNVSAYQITGVEFLCSNMIVHTFVKNKGHYLYLPYVGLKYTLVYDSRFLIPYRIIRSKRLSKYIDFSSDVIVLKIDDKIDYSMFRIILITEVVFILLTIKLGVLVASLIMMLHILSLITLKNSEK